MEGKDPNQAPWPSDSPWLPLTVVSPPFQQGEKGEFRFPVSLLRWPEALPLVLDRLGSFQELRSPGPTPDQSSKAPQGGANVQPGLRNHFLVSGKVLFKGSMNVTGTRALVLNAANSRRLSAVLFHTVWQTTNGSRGPRTRVYHGSSNSQVYCHAAVLVNVGHPVISGPVEALLLSGCGF